MLLIQVHQLHVKVRNTVAILWLKDKSDNIRTVLRLDSDNVIIVGTLHDLSQRCQVHSHWHVTVASVVFEPFRPQAQTYKWDVAVIHGLQLKSSFWTCVIKKQNAAIRVPNTTYSYLCASHFSAKKFDSLNCTYNQNWLHLKVPW